MELRIEYQELEWPVSPADYHRAGDGDGDTYQEIAALDALEELDKVSLNFVNQEILEYFVRSCGRRVKYLHLGRCYYLDDLSPLEDLDRLECLGIYINQRAEKLWDLSKNKRLRGLRLQGFTRIHTLEGVEAAPSLDYLSFGNGLYPTAVLRDVEPLLDSHITGFSFDGKKIEHDDLTIYTRISTLRYLHLPNRLYSTRQLAWLAAHNLTGPDLCPYYVIYPEPRNEMDKNVIINGRRKPMLNSIRDAVRIEKYERQFNDWLAYYRGAPEEGPPDH